MDSSAIFATLQSFRDFETLQHAAVGLHDKLRPVTMRQLQGHSLRVDAISKDLYPSDGPNFTPFSIYGDGNCLPRCCSLLAYGTEEHHLEMRVRIVIELAVNKAHYLSYPVARFCAQYSDQYHGEVLSDLAVERIYEAEIFDACRPGTYMGFWQMLAVSSVLQVSLWSVYPQYGGYTVRHHLHQIITPRTAPMEAGQPIVHGIMWTHTQGKHLPASQWSPNHFVVCLPTNYVQRQESKDVQQESSTMKLGDFVLVGISTDRNVTKYVAQISRLTEEGGWGVYLKAVGGGKWKFPGKMSEFFLPQCDILTVLQDYVMSQEGRTVLYKFEM
ncbi:vertnin-like [Littorina saxatilis]|uniref:vertnin-like n=1 Tax=Littorina saxatilis TaxID=31220 RepID=UPI0038B48D12